MNNIINRRRIIKEADNTHSLPKEYIECEYIQRMSGTETIDTNIVADSSTWEFEAQCTATPGATDIIIARSSGGGNWVGALSYSGQWGLKAGYGVGNVYERQVVEVEFTTTGVTVRVGEDEVTRIGSPAASSVKLLGISSDLFKGKLFHVKRTDAVSFEGIPVKSIDDSLYYPYGLFDIVNGTFYRLSSFTGKLKNVDNPFEGWTLGYRLNGDGLVVEPGHAVTPYYPVSPGDVIKVVVNTSKNCAVFAYENQDGETKSFLGWANNEFTVPDGRYFIRASMTRSGISNTERYIKNNTTSKYYFKGNDFYSLKIPEF